MSRFLLRRKSRHLPPCLIFDVRQKYMSAYRCQCGYEWDSRKRIGAPARCPSCGAKTISPISQIRKEIGPSSGHTYDITKTFKTSGKSWQGVLPPEAFDENGNIIYQQSDGFSDSKPTQTDWRYQKPKIDDEATKLKMEELRQKIRDRIRNEK